MEETQEKVVSVGCGNVVFYIMLKTEFDWNKFQYLAKKIEDRYPLQVPDLFSWCNMHKVDYITKYRYLKTFGVWDNVMNYVYYVYCRFHNHRELLAFEKE